MVIVSDVCKSQTFVAIVSKQSMHDKILVDTIVNRCKLAEVTGKPMYMIAEEGVNLGVLKDMSWEKIFYFANRNDVPNIMAFLEFEVSGGALYT